jgi:hypothetical protein
MITVLPKAENGRRHDANRTRAQFDCGEALSEITAIANKMRQGRSNASSSGNQLRNAGSSLMIWRGVVKTPVEAADVIGHGGHRFGERDPGSCMACSDVTAGTRYEFFT